MGFTDEEVPATRQFARKVLSRAPQTLELYRLTRNPRRQIGRWRSQVRWHRALSSVRALETQHEQGHAVLITYSDQSFDVRLRCVVATALRSRGWQVSAIIRNRRSAEQQRLLRSAGVTDHIVDEDFRLTQLDEDYVHSAAQDMLSGPLTFDDVRSWEFEGAWIGPMLLSSASRALLDGRPDPAKPDVRDVVARLLPSVLRRVLRSHRILDEVHFDLGVLDEYHYSVAGPIVDVGIARGVDFITLRPMFRSDSLLPTRLTESSRRLHHAAVTRTTVDGVHETWNADRERELQEVLESRFPTTSDVTGPGSRVVDRAGLCEALGVTDDRPIVVVFAHVLWDANLFYGRDLFADFGDWLGQTAKAAMNNDRVTWAIKLHPANLEKAVYHGSSRSSEVEILQQYCGTLDLGPHVRIVEPDTPLSTRSFYEHADVGITVRGTPGIEMPCFGRPVLTAGTGRYEGLGFTVDSDSVEEYLDRLASIEEITPLRLDQVRQARAHAYALFVRREWRSKSFRIDTDVPIGTQRIIDPTDELIHPEGCGDLQRLADWMINDSTIDYVADR